MDEEGKTYTVMKEITDHKTDARAVAADNGYVESPNGERRRRVTTAGWWLQVEWKDGSLSWVPLKDLKASNPIEVAEYAVANKIAEEPAFAWWVRAFLRRRDRIIKKVKHAIGSAHTSMGLNYPTVLRRHWLLTHKRGLTIGERLLRRR